MNILIVGAKGQLGSEIIGILSKGRCSLGEISKELRESNIVQCDIDNLDITNLNGVRKFFSDIAPDIIINCAAYTNVDGCEENSDLAFSVNALGARNLAICSEELGAKLIHVSTDYVFNGEGSTPFCEYDLPSPVSVYGKSKYLGEQYIREFSSKYFILRTAWLYGKNGNNFVYTMMKHGKDKGMLKVVDDQRGNPTNAEDLAYHILKLALTEEYGVYHCTGKGECSWYDFACEIIRLAGINCEVNPCTTEEFPRPAKRPAYSSLDNMMLRSTVGDEMRDWKEALNSFFESK